MLNSLLLQKHRGGRNKVFSVVCLDRHRKPAASLTKAVALVLAWNASVALEMKGDVVGEAALLSNDGRPDALKRAQKRLKDIIRYSADRSLPVQIMLTVESSLERLVPSSSQSPAMPIRSICFLAMLPLSPMFPFHRCLSFGHFEGLSCAVNPADVWEAFGAIKNDRSVDNDQTVGRTDHAAGSNGDGIEIKRNGGMSQFASVLEPAGLLIEYQDDFEHSGLEYQVPAALFIDAYGCINVSCRNGCLRFNISWLIDQLNLWL